jgi:hypothetical protein
VVASAAGEAEEEAGSPSVEEGWKEVDAVRWEDEEVGGGEVRGAEEEESPLLSPSRSLSLVSCQLVALHLVPSLLPLCQC